MGTNQLPRLLTELETAEALSCRPATLAAWRCTGRTDLPFVKVGRLVRYREADVLAFLDRRTRQTIAPAA